MNLEEEEDKEPGEDDKKQRGSVKTNIPTSEAVLQTAVRIVSEFHKTSGALSQP